MACAELGPPFLVPLLILCPIVNPFDSFLGFTLNLTYWLQVPSEAFLHFSQHLNHCRALATKIVYSPPFHFHASLYFLFGHFLTQLDLRAPSHSCICSFIHSINIVEQDRNSFYPHREFIPVEKQTKRRKEEQYTNRHVDNIYQYNMLYTIC